MQLPPPPKVTLFPSCRGAALSDNHPAGALPPGSLGHSFPIMPWGGLQRGPLLTLFLLGASCLQDAVRGASRQCSSSFLPHSLFSHHALSEGPPADTLPPFSLDLSLPIMPWGQAQRPPAGTQYPFPASALFFHHLLRPVSQRRSPL